MRRSLVLVSALSALLVSQALDVDADREFSRAVQNMNEDIDRLLKPDIPDELHANLVQRLCEDGSGAVRELCASVGAACSRSSDPVTCSHELVSRARYLRACEKADPAVSLKKCAETVGDLKRRLQLA